MVENQERICFFLLFTVQENYFEKTFIEVFSPHVYDSFGSF